MVVCFDGILRIGITPPDHCRHIFLNVTGTSLFLLLMIHLCFSLFQLQFTTLYRLVASKQVGGAARYLAWAASIGYTLFYSFYVTFLYVNDEWYPRLEWQLLFTAMEILQFFACHYVLVAGTAEGGKGGETPNPIFVYSALGATLFALSFNVFIESFCSDTVGFRTFLHIWGDFAVVFVTLRLYPAPTGYNRRKIGIVVLVTMATLLVMFIATKRMSPCHEKSTIPSPTSS